MRLGSKIIVGSLVVANCLYAEAWEDILKGIDPNQEIVDNGSLVSAKSIYEGQIRYKIIDGDGEAGNFGDGDKGYIEIIRNDGTVLKSSTDGSTLSSDDLETWAEDNADEIIASIFGGDPAGALSGKNSGITQSAETAAAIQKIEIDGAVVQSKTLLGSESLTIKNGSTDVTGSGGLFGWGSSSDSGNSYGIIVNYKMTEADDAFNSETSSLSLSPYYKINYSVDDKLKTPVLISLSANLVYMESTIFPDGAGYLEYGLGLGVTPEYKLQNNWYLTSILNIQHLQKSIPSSYVPEDAKWVADAINNLAALKVLSYGVGTKYDIQSNWRAEANILQTKHLVTDNIKDGREKATYYSASTAYDWESWTFGIGYKIVEDLEDYEEDAYMLSAKYNW